MNRYYNVARTYEDQRGKHRKTSTHLTTEYAGLERRGFG